MISPSCFLNACSYSPSPSQVVLVEPWTEEGDEEPLVRTVIAFVTHPGLQLRAAAHLGEHFLTRLTFIDPPPPPTVTLGDPAWDQVAVTRAYTQGDAQRAFHPELRALLLQRGFRGHIELRAGGAIVYLADRLPTPAHLSELAHVLPEIVNVAIRYPR